MLTSNNKKGPVVLITRDISFIFPSGYGYLAGYLVEHDEDVKILIRPNDKKNYHEFVKEIINLEPLLVGFGSLYTDLSPIKEIIKLLNDANRDFPIVIGGQMVSPTPEFSVEITRADIGVIGEGEIILHNIVKALRNSENIEQVGGLVINNGKENKLTGPGEYIEDLTKLPKIPYDLFPSTEWLHVGRMYIDMPQPHNQYNDRTVTIHGGRGCPFRCNFCYHHSRPRYRPIEDMLEDAKYLIKKFDANILYFDDDLAIISPDRAEKLAEGIMKLPKKVEWSVSARFDILERISDDILLKMKKSGLRTMSIGVESGSERILKIIDKKITVEQMLKGFMRLKKYGILPNSCIMVGQHTETNEDVQKSMDLMEKVIKMNKNMNWSFSTTIPFPGSKLYDICFEKGWLKSHRDFYERFETCEDMTKPTVNMTKMTDDEILNWKKRFKERNKLLRRRAIGPKVFYIEELRVRAERLNKRINDKYLNKLPNNLLGNLIKKIYNTLYNAMQITFDIIRLKLLSVKKYEV
jgi:anaerobic magnesium-protoporphyrin IX monomethyl ester cyclase